MITAKTSWLYLFLFLSFFSFCLTAEDLEEKIYIKYDQIHLNEGGMFLLTDKGVMLIQQLHCDEEGFYIPTIPLWTKEKCANGHDVTCRRCHGCNWRRCEHACQCR